MKTDIELFQAALATIRDLCDCVPPAEKFAKPTPLQEAHNDALPVISELAERLKQEIEQP